MKEIVVVYYSRSGTVRGVAERLAALLEADLEEIREAKDRAGFRGLLSAGCDALLKREVALAHMPSVAGRKTVVLGMPTWAFGPPPPVRAWLRNAFADSTAQTAPKAKPAADPSADLGGKKLCAFCACYALGGGHALATLARLASTLRRSTAAKDKPDGLAARLCLKRPAADPNLGGILKTWAGEIARLK